MRTTYRISAKEIGTIYLRRRRIAKALRWWLRENGILFNYSYSFNDHYSYSSMDPFGYSSGKTGIAVN
jgi:hypothetical protein